MWDAHSLLMPQEVSHKTCNLAGNVYDLVYAVSQDLWKGFGVDAISGRIKDDHIRFLRHLVQNLQHIPGNKTAVINAVKCSVFSGGFYRVFHDLHTDHLAGNRRCKLCICFFFSLFINLINILLNVCLSGEHFKLDIGRCDFQV